MAHVSGQFKDLVSVIIPIRRGENITHVLQSVASSTYPSIETIVVDEGLERSRQRNIGIQRAKGRYLLILDSDQSVSPVLIAECVSILRKKPNIGGVFIPEKIIASGFFGAVRKWERQFYTGTPVDCVRFVRAEKCPLFDEDLTGPEDADWNNRVPGGKTTSLSCLYHHDDISLVKYLKKKAYYSKSMRRYAEKWPNDKVLDWRWRCWGVFTENGKREKFFANPAMAASVMLLILVRGIIYKINK